jgi:glycosyltransferase involved in cell wall biosynthesis
MADHMPDRLPTVSVLMPIRNEAGHIQRSLEAVLQQEYPAEQMEVLVADGMSDDGTRQIVSSYQADHPNLRLIDNPGRIVPTGLNAALREARGEVIIRVDGHTIIAPDYARQCVDALQRTSADNAGGRMNAIGQGAFGEAVALATSSPFGVGGARFHYSEQEEWVDTVYMGAWPRRVFDEIGLFDEEMVRNQDDEFNYRLSSQGGRILLSPDIKSVYTVRGSPARLWKQYFQYGYWKVRVLQKHPRQMRLRQFAPPAFAAGLLAALLLAPVTFVGRWLLAGIAVAYGLANLSASLITVAHKGWKHLILLPLVYAILHLSYGLGFLAGLVKFAGRWGDQLGKVPSFERRSEEM